MQKRLFVAAIVISISSMVVIAQVEQPGPMPGTYVHDFAGVIADDKKAEIQAKAQRLKDEYQTEIALVTIDSLQGEDSFDYSMRMARSWGIGSPDNDIRGLLILVAVKDRKTSFRTSRHVEGEIPDAVTNDISRVMNGYFKGGDFGGGLSAGMDKILARLQTIYEPAAAAAAVPQKQSRGWVWFWVVVWGGVIVLMVVGAVRKKIRKMKQRETAARQNRANFFSDSKTTRPKSGRAKKQSRSKARGKAGKSKHSRPTESSAPSSSYDSGYSSSYGSSSSYDSGSSSSSDSGSSYSGGSDFGGGGSDSSW